MNVIKWASTYVGGAVTAPGGLGGQCVDLANLYLLARGKPAVRRNAVDWHQAGAIMGWRWEKNSPTNYPPPGAVVVWNRNVTAIGTGENGHVAVALAADPFSLLSLDQGWPPGAPVGLVWHSYTGVLGWWVPGP